MDLALLKVKIYAACLNYLNLKINQFEASLLDLTQGAQNDSKSSSGDKHETARAMMQIEYEKIGNQLKEAKMQKEELERINPESSSKKITKGSLIKTNKGFLFLSVGIGKLSVESSEVIILSPQSPLGIKLQNLSLGNSSEMNGTTYTIEAIS
ncbi:MAG: hypothetical protein IPP32_10170 [Bacteroidetes bacterium]|nr:hypothetical protein [Bacteroidota bacterium]